MKHGAVACALVCAGVSFGAAAPVGPFTGDVSDPLNYPGFKIDWTIPIFGGGAVMTSKSPPATSIHLIAGSTFAGDPVQPKTGGLILGFTSGPGYIVFDAPVSRFGAFMDVNHGGDDAHLEFYGAGGSLVDAVVAAIPGDDDAWVWQGWEFDAPVVEIKVWSDGVLDGFTWFEDLEVTYAIPSPGGAALAGAVCVGAGRRQRRGSSASGRA